MTSPYRGHDPATPPGAEAALQAFSDALDAARIALEEARNEEVEKLAAYRAARRKARFSAECPEVGVFDGVRVTVAAQNDWLDDRVADEEMEYLMAKTARQAASEHLRTLREQGIIQQSITKSVAQAYQQTRTGERW